MPPDDDFLSGCFWSPRDRQTGCTCLMLTVALLSLAAWAALWCVWQNGG